MIEDMQKLKHVKIEELIYEVRGQHVMLDSDLARLYEYKGGTKVINQAVKRNIEIFEANSYFQITEKEYETFGYLKVNLKSQLVTSSGHGGSRKGHLVFTLEGIKILSTILKKQTVSIVNQKIFESFENVKRKNTKYLAIPVNKSEKIENLIYNVRGVQVMLDFDLARIYECKNGTKTINLAVKRHQNMFPNDIYFQLNDEESKFFWFQFETKKMNIETRGGKYNNPYAFTEEGVYTLATIIRTPVAEAVTSSIIKAFVSMRNYIGESLIDQNHFNNQILINSQNINENRKSIKRNQQDIKLLKEALSKFETNKVNNAVFYAGQLYDAYSLLVDIISKSQEEVIIVDGYAGKETLDILSKIHIKAILIVREKSKRGNLSDLDIEKYNEQYNNLTVIRTNAFHDRFIILDRDTVYHCGSSINRAGTGAFAINLIEGEEFKTQILELILKTFNIKKNP